MWIMQILFNELRMNSMNVLIAVVLLAQLTLSSGAIYGDYPWVTADAVASMSAPVPNSRFGTSVAMSDDYLLVGAYKDAESVYIYKRSDDTGWSTSVLNTFVGDSGNGKFGQSVDISSTGRYVIIGAPIDDAAYIFTQNMADNGWAGNSSVSNITVTLSGNAGSKFGGGASVAITDHYACVGAYSEGMAYIYENDASSGWSATPVASITAYTGDTSFGWSVSMTDSYILVGCADNAGNGANKAYIFEKGGVWSTTAATTISAYTGDAGFGMSVSLNNQFAVIGAYSARKAYVFRYNTGTSTWPTTATTTIDDAGQPDFGSSVAIRSDSAYLVVGAAAAKKAFIFDYISASNTFDTTGTAIVSTVEKFGGEAGGGVAYSNRSLVIGSSDGAFLYDQYCSAGTYNVLGRTSAGDCTDCSAGYFRDTTGATNCSACAAGTFQQATGGLSCATCNVGKYVEITAGTACSQCDAGTYTNLVASANCTDCPSNYYSTILGASQLSDCLACASGTFSQAGSSECSSSCTSGSYFDGTTCIQCNSGKYLAEDGSTDERDCIRCPVGTYGMGKGNSVCTDCPGGTYNDEEQQNKLQDCHNCAVGKYSDAGAEVCTLCPAGTYEDDTGQAVCTSCATGTSNANTGSTAASDCLTCAVGTYAATAGSVECTKCGAGKANANTGSTVASACSDCAVGYYAAEGSEMCTACPDGQTTEGAGSGLAVGSCTDCAGGTYSAAATTGMVCTACDAGAFSDAGATECTICPLGSFSAVAGSAVCTLCPIAFYGDVEGALACVTCPGGRITPGEGALGVNECVSPEVNFITAFVIIAAVIPMAMEYVVHARFVRLAFLRRERITSTIVTSYKDFSRRLWRGLMKADAERLMNTKYMQIKTVLFLFGSIFVTGISALMSFVLLMASIFFKSMIVWRGLNIDKPFEEIMNSILAAFNKWTGPLLGYLFYPFVALFDLVVLFEIDLESVDITCKGSSAPLELFINLIVLGLCIIIIDSEFNIFKGITWASLAELHLQQVTAPTYRKWAVQENGAKAKPTLRGYLRYGVLVLASFVMLSVVGIDIFQGFLQYCMSSLTINSFLADSGKHAYSPECNNVDNYKRFDSLIAGLASGEFWLLVLPALYEISKLMLPGISHDKLSDHFLAMLALNVDKKAGPSSSYFHLAKYSSLCNPDLWIAALSEHWLRYIDANLVPESGKNVKSMRQQQLDDRQDEERLMHMSMAEYASMEQANLQPRLIAPTSSWGNGDGTVEVEDLPLDYNDILPPYRPLFRVIVGTGSTSPNSSPAQRNKDLKTPRSYRGHILQSRGGFTEKNRVYSTIPPESDDDYVYQEGEVGLAKVDRVTGMVRWRRVYAISVGDFEDDYIPPTTRARTGTLGGKDTSTSNGDDDDDDNDDDGDDDDDNDNDNDNDDDDDDDDKEIGPGLSALTMRRESRVEHLMGDPQGSPSLRHNLRVSDLIQDLSSATHTDMLILYTTGNPFSHIYDNDGNDGDGSSTKTSDDGKDRSSQDGGAITVAEQLKRTLLLACPLMDWGAFASSYGFVMVNTPDSPHLPRSDTHPTKSNSDSNDNHTIVAHTDDYDFGDTYTDSADQYAHSARNDNNGSSPVTDKASSFFQYVIADHTETVDLAFELLADGFSIPHQMPLHRSHRDSFFLCCLNRKSKLLASLQLRTRVEDMNWKKKQKMQMPSYLVLCRMEYDELMGRYEKPVSSTTSSGSGSGSGSGGGGGKGSKRQSRIDMLCANEEGSGSTDGGAIDVVVEKLLTPARSPRNEEKERKGRWSEQQNGVIEMTDLGAIDLDIEGKDEDTEEEEEKKREGVEQAGHGAEHTAGHTRPSRSPAPVAVRWLYMALIFFGFGHLFTRVGREAWYIVGHKYALFLLTCLGIWTTDAAITLDIKAKVDHVSIAYDKPYVPRSKEVYLQTRQRLKRPINRHSWVYAMLHPEESKVYQWIQHAWIGGIVRNVSKNKLEDGDGDGGGGGSKPIYADDRDSASDLGPDGREYPDAYYEGYTLRSLQQEELKRKYRQDTAQMLYEVIATRAVLLQIVPSLVLLSIYASTMGNTPLCVLDEELATNLPELIVYDPFGEALAMEEEAIREAQYIRQNLDIHQNKVRNPHYRYHKHKGRWVAIHVDERNEIEMRNRYFELALKRAINPHAELTVEEMKALVDKGKDKHKKKGCRGCCSCNNCMMSASEYVALTSEYVAMTIKCCDRLCNNIVCCCSELCSLCHPHHDDDKDDGDDKNTKEGKDGKVELSAEVLASLCSHPRETPDMWIVLFEGMNIYFNHSRLINLFYNLFSYLMVLALILAPSEHLEGWVIAAIVVLFPHCVFGALESVIVIGKAWWISDENIIEVLHYIRLDGLFKSILQWMIPRHRRLDPDDAKIKRESMLEEVDIMIDSSDAGSEEGIFSDVEGVHVDLLKII